MSDGAAKSRKKKVAFCTLADHLTEDEIEQLANVIADVNERGYNAIWATAARRRSAPPGLRPPNHIDIDKAAYRWWGRVSSDAVPYSLLIFDGPEPDSVLLNETAHALIVDCYVFLDPRIDGSRFTETVDEIVDCLDALDDDHGWACVGPEQYGDVASQQLSNADARSLAARMDVIAVTNLTFLGLGGLPAHPDIGDRVGLAQTLLSGTSGTVVASRRSHPVRHVKETRFIEQRREVIRSGAFWSPHIDGLSVLMAVGPDSVPTLRDAVRSIAAQQVDVPVQLCAGYDGSAFDARKAGIKGTLRIAEKAGVEVSFRVMGKQYGPGAARNALAEDAKYDLLCFADGDDLVLPNAYQLMVNGMRAYPAAGWMVGGSTFWRPDREPKPPWIASYEAMIAANSVKPSSFAPLPVPYGALWASGKNMVTSHSSDPVMVMRRDLALLYGMCGAFGLHEDWYLQHGVAFVPGLDAGCDFRLYRIHANQLTQQPRFSNNAALQLRWSAAHLLADRLGGPRGADVKESLRAGNWLWEENGPTGLA
jgi:hypothetical protein